MCVVASPGIATSGPGANVAPGVVVFLALHHWTAASPWSRGRWPLSRQHRRQGLMGRARSLLALARRMRGPHPTAQRLHRVPGGAPPYPRSGTSHLPLVKGDAEPLVRRGLACRRAVYPSASESLGVLRLVMRVLCERERWSVDGSRDGSPTVRHVPADRLTAPPAERAMMLAHTAVWLMAPTETRRCP